jgi:hypothetical protein
MKKKTITIENETQENEIKEALKFRRELKQFGITKNDQSQRKEKLIHEVSEIEKIEKQLN